MIVENQAGIPLVMQALAGNSSDKNSFTEAITTPIEHLQANLGVDYIVGDSALYTANSLEQMKAIYWISRVPETLSDALYIIEEMSPRLMADLHQEAHSSVCMSYAGVHKQRWVVNYSPQAYQRALSSVLSSVNKQCLTLSSQELKQFNTTR